MIERENKIYFIINTGFLYGRLLRLSYYSKICEAVVKLPVGFSPDIPSNMLHKNSLKEVIVTRVKLENH